MIVRWTKRVFVIQSTLPFRFRRIFEKILMKTRNSLRVLRVFINCVVNENTHSTKLSLRPSLLLQYLLQSFCSCFSFDYYGKFKHAYTNQVCRYYAIINNDVLQQKIYIYILMVVCISLSLAKKYIIA